MAGYVYKGSKKDSACGTDAGYRRHRRAGEKPCESCRKAHNLATTDGLHCGTVRGYRVHIQRSQTPCPLCAAAKLQATVEKRIDLQPCGTRAAYDRHIRKGQKTCKKCREGHARRRREARKK